MEDDYDNDDSIADPDFELGAALSTKSILDEQMTTSDDYDKDMIKTWNYE